MRRARANFYSNLTSRRAQVEVGRAAGSLEMPD